MTEFPERNFSLASVKRLLHKIDTTGSADRKSGSGRRRTARCGVNVELVEDLALSQEDVPGTHRSVCQIARKTGITKSSVDSIMHHDLRVYRCWIRDIDHLTERLIAEWRRFDHNVLDRAVNQWWERLRGCVRENGGHFEHQIQTIKLFNLTAAVFVNRIFCWFYLEFDFSQMLRCILKLHTIV